MGDMLNFVDNGNRIFEWWGSTAAYVGSTLGSPIAATAWQPWCKSWVRGATFIDIWLVGAGAGGGGAAPHTTGLLSSGAGGGGSGGIVAARFLLDTLPDVLYVALPQGAAGGIANTAGENGGGAYIAIAPFTGTQSAVTLLTTTAASFSSQAGGPSSNGGAGTPLVGSMTLFQIAISGQIYTGSAGTVGGSADIAVNPLTTFNVVTGGAGGGGSTNIDVAGGSITVGTQDADVIGGLAGPNRGADGWFNRDNPHRPWRSVGGAGGGSSNTAATVGGVGGNGGIGSGGGGGGTGPTGGAGGRGGDAYMLLVAS